MSVERPEILFATIAAGGGHVATAWAMAEAIEKLYPGRFTARVSDYMKEVGATAAAVAALDRRHKDSWRVALKYPVLARVSQRLMDAAPRATIQGQRLLLRGFARAAARDLGKRPPRLIVSNHGLLTTGLSEARRRHGLNAPLLTFVTEPHNVGAYWADPTSDDIVVPSEETRANLVRFGVPAARISVAGYPVRRAFLEAPGKEEARARLGLEDRPTFLISFGGEGVTKDPRRLVRDLLDLDLRPQVVVITGRNVAMKGRLDGLRTGRLRVEGYVEDVATFLAACDVFVGKAGPASVYEAIAVGRPMLITGYAGLNELGVLGFVERNGLGRHARTPGEVIEGARHYASDPELLEEVARRCRAVDLKSETERLAHHVARYAASPGVV